MKIVRALVSVLVVMGIAASVSAAPKKASRSQQSKHEHRYSTAADPQGIDLVKYPKDEKAPMSIKRQMELGLKVAQLRYDWWGLNWHREIGGGRWLWEKIPAGKIVLVDKNGNQIYKADCVNRLVWMPRNPFTGLPCPKCPPVAGGGKGRGGAGAPGASGRTTGRTTGRPDWSGSGSGRWRRSSGSGGWCGTDCRRWSRR